MWGISVPAILHISAIRLIVSTSAPSCEVPIAVIVRTPLSWACAISSRTYSMVIPGTVPGAGRRMISAPASINSSTSFFVMICSPPSPGTPEACIFPAAKISLSFSRADMALSESVMARLLTPFPGFPVRSTISTPISEALTAFSTVAFRPADIAQSVSSFLRAA